MNNRRSWLKRKRSKESLSNGSRMRRDSLRCNKKSKQSFRFRKKTPDFKRNKKTYRKSF